MFKSFARSARGNSHIRDGKPNQDCAMHWPGDIGFDVVAVADGHGGDKYFRSGMGAWLACYVGIWYARECMITADFTRIMSDPDAPDSLKEKMLVRLEESIISGWGQKVMAHMTANPFTDEELCFVGCAAADDYSQAVKAYGTTLLLAVTTRDYWFGFQIGDGTFVTVSETGGYSQPVELDPRCAGTFVTSICDRDAIGCFRHAWGFERINAVFLASDGVDESFSSEQMLYNFYDKILSGAQDDFEGTINDLTEFLPELSARGSKDDVSVAGLIRVAE
jgi:serine/threonine protein phosphatase PrpC